MQPGAHHLARAEIPLVVFVAVLALGADVGDFVGDAGRRVETFAAQAVAAQTLRRGLGPHGPREQFQQLGLAGAVAADQQPALSRADAPVDVAQHGAPAAIEIDAAERDGKMGFGGAGARHASARSLPQAEVASGDGSEAIG